MSSNSRAARYAVAAALFLFAITGAASAQDSPPDTKSVEEFSGDLSTGQEVANVVSFPFRIIAYAVYYPLKFIFYDVWAWLFDLFFGGGGPSESDYADMLGHADSARRIKGLRGLANIRAASSLGPIIALFEDADPDVRNEAVMAVGRIGSDSKSAELIDMAGGRSPPDARACAILALGLLREKAALGVLLKALDDPAWQIRECALAALGALRDVASGPAVAARLRDGDGRVRRAAALALGNIGDPAALPALMAVIDSPGREGSAVLSAAIVSAGRLGGAPEAERIFAILTSPGLGQDPYVRGAAARTLGEMGFAKAEPELVRMLFADRDEYAVGGAAAGLAMLGRLGPLVEAMKSDNPVRRMAGAEGARLAGDPAAVPHLTGLLSDPYSDVRGAAIYAMLALGAGEAVGALISQLEASDVQMRAWALAMLRRISGEDLGLDAEAWLSWWRGNAQKINLKALFPQEPRPEKKLGRADREKSRIAWSRAARHARAAG